MIAYRAQFEPHDRAAIGLSAPGSWAAEIDHLSECIELGKEPRTPGEEGLRDVRIMQALHAPAC